jgi:hypothetical protein
VPQVFPELKPNPFFFTGESYAGIYVPGFAEVSYLQPLCSTQRALSCQPHHALSCSPVWEALMNDPIPGLNFQGWAVGDGWTGCKAPPRPPPSISTMPRLQKVPGKPINWCVDLDNVGLFKYPNVYPGPYYDVEFFHGHSQFSTELYKKIKSSCPEPELRGQVPLTFTCSGLVDEMARQVGYWFPYNLYNDCPAKSMRRLLSTKHTPKARPDKHGIHAALRTRRAALAQLHKGFVQDSAISSPCLGNAMNEWLLHPDTLKACRTCRRRPWPSQKA